VTGLTGRGIASLLAAVAVAVAGCQSGLQAPDPDTVYPPGTCVVFTASGEDGAVKDMVRVDCSEPHSHVVVARVGPDVTCPPGADAEMLHPGERYGLWCLQAGGSDPSASPRQ